MEKQIEETLLDAWLDDVYDSSSNLVNSRWVEMVSTSGKWIFDSAQIRSRVFYEATLETKHIKK